MTQVNYTEAERIQKYKQLATNANGTPKAEIMKKLRDKDGHIRGKREKYLVLVTFSVNAIPYWTSNKEVLLHSLSKSWDDGEVALE